MYTIINKTQNKDFKFIGSYPMDIIYSMLNNGDDIIVISSYSNTIKIPVGIIDEYTGEWEFKEYNYSLDMFK